MTAPLPDRLLAFRDAAESTNDDEGNEGRATYVPVSLQTFRDAMDEAAAALSDGREAVIPESEWRWHGLAAHFICAADCLFHMATEVGEYMISTVGDLRLHTNGEGRSERQEIGCGRTYETFVFKTKGTRCTCGCGMPEIELSEIDSEGANDPATARANHMALCAKYAAAPSAKGGAE